MCCDVIFISVDGGYDCDCDRRLMSCCLLAFGGMRMFASLSCSLSAATVGLKGLVTDLGDFGGAGSVARRGVMFTL